MSHYFLCSQNNHSKNRRFFQCMVSDFVARLNFAKKESRSPRGFLPRPLLRAGESEFRTPPPFPQKNEAGCGQEFRSKKVRANAKITPPNETLSRRTRSATTMFFADPVDNEQVLHQHFGGPEEIRTPDLLLAKQAF